MTNETQKKWESLITLVTGLADAESARGLEFFYKGSKLYSEDVADLLMPSILCLAQGTSSVLGMGNFGYSYSMEGNSQPGEFPLSATPNGAIAPFHRIAPFVVHAFDSYVLKNHADITYVFEAAAQTINFEFTLKRNTRLGQEIMEMDIQQQSPRV